MTPNHHGSAKGALDEWLRGSLWGFPIQLGPDKFHVYGPSASASSRLRELPPPKGGGFPVQWAGLGMNSRDSIQQPHHARGSALQGHWLPALRRKFLVQLLESLLEHVDGGVDVPVHDCPAPWALINPLPLL